MNQVGTTWLPGNLWRMTITYLRLIPFFSYLNRVERLQNGTPTSNCERSTKGFPRIIEDFQLKTWLFSMSTHGTVSIIVTPVNSSTTQPNLIRIYVEYAPYKKESKVSAGPGLQTRKTSLQLLCNSLSPNYGTVYVSLEI